MPDKKDPKKDEPKVPRGEIDPAILKYEKARKGARLGGSRVIDKDGRVIKSDHPSEVDSPKTPAPAPKED